jgi:hypothetical protein
MISSCSRSVGSHVGAEPSRIGGLEIRITNFKFGTVGRYADGGHPGDPIVLFTVHIKNGTSHKVDADEFSVEVTYGPDDDDAEAIHGQWVRRRDRRDC